MFIIHDDNDGNLIIPGYCMLDHPDKSFAVVAAAPPVGNTGITALTDFKMKFISITPIRIDSAVTPECE